MSHPDYVPSCFNHSKASTSGSVVRFLRADTRHKRRRIDYVPQINGPPQIDDSPSQTPQVDVSPTPNDDSLTQSNNPPNSLEAFVQEVDVSSYGTQVMTISPGRIQEMLQQKLLHEKEELRLHVFTLSSEIESLKEELKLTKFGAESLRGNDEMTCFYTGLPSYALFQKLFDLLKPLTSLKLLGIDGFLSAIVKLRLNVPFKDLSHRLGYSTSYASYIFHGWLDLMYVHLQQLVLWPDLETLQNNMPSVFRKNFKRTRCIIDCFEVFIERPLSFDVRAVTYSNYKKHNTIKVFIAVSPTGSICFISRAWGGRVSDKVITQQCGFLDKLEHGDIVIADRGFNVHDDIGVRGAKLVIPASTKGRSQLPREDIEKSRELSRVRIHVERVIGQLRKKYTILHGTLPISLVRRPSDTNISTIDKVLVVTSALTNLSDPVLRQ